MNKFELAQNYMQALDPMTPGGPVIAGGAKSTIQKGHLTEATRSRSVVEYTDEISL